MITYITAFIFYTLAMIGIMLIGFVIYKKTFMMNKSESKGTMKILDCIQIAPKKNLLIVKVKNEKFLIASGAEHTTFLAKLEDEASVLKNIMNTTKEQNFKSAQKTETSFENTNAALNQQENFEKQAFVSKYTESEKPSNDFQQARLNKIQKQFRELYELEPTQGNNFKTAMNKKEAVKQLLKDLNETTSGKVGNRF